MNYQFTRTKDGKPCIGVGGGAMTKTYTGRTVIDKHGNLKDPVFVRTTGHRCNAHDQAIVLIEVEDIIVHMQGNFPINDENNENKIDARKIIELVEKTDTAITQPYPLTYKDLPEKVIAGLLTRHNRDGMYFCREVLP